jgi:hypothetical protein
VGKEIGESLRRETLERCILANPSAGSVFIASGLSVVKQAIEKSGLVDEARGDRKVVADLLAICVTKYGVNPGPPSFLACLAFYIFADLVFRPALAYVLSYVSGRDYRIAGEWPSHFATHSLKILTGQSDINQETMIYDTQNRRDTVNSAVQYCYVMSLI